MIFVVMKCLLSVLLAVGGGLLGSRWIAASYRRAKNEEGLLSFPDRIEEQEKKRPARFAVCIGFLFCFTMLELPYVHLAKLVFLMIFQYFMVLYTWTDLEQRVIFDRMLIPFAVIGLISVPLLDRVLTDHLMAAAVGGIVFLVLAVLTKGGIGGGGYQARRGARALARVGYAHDGRHRGHRARGDGGAHNAGDRKAQEGRLLRLRALLHDQRAAVYAALRYVCQGPGNVFRLRRSAE